MFAQPSNQLFLFRDDFVAMLVFFFLTSEIQVCLASLQCQVIHCKEKGIENTMCIVKIL